MRAEVFGMVGWVSRMAEGEEREAHFIRRTKSAERVVDVWPSWASACLGLKVLLGWGWRSVRPGRRRLGGRVTEGIVRNICKERAVRCVPAPK
jgi:hypothetical protein